MNFLFVLVLVMVSHPPFHCTPQQAVERVGLGALLLTQILRFASSMHLN